jgi:hypothetical protein
VVVEAVKSFQLNIALFDEVEELSQKQMLAPTLVRPEVKVPQLAHVPQTTSKETKRSLTMATSVIVAVTAVVVGALVYRKVQKV